MQFYLFHSIIHMEEIFWSLLLPSSTILNCHNVFRWALNVKLIYTSHKDKPIHVSSLFPWGFCWAHWYPNFDIDFASDQGPCIQSCQLHPHTSHRELEVYVQQQNLKSKKKIVSAIKYNMNSQMEVEKHHWNSKRCHGNVMQN